MGGQRAGTQCEIKGQTTCEYISVLVYPVPIPTFCVSDVCAVLAPGTTVGSANQHEPCVEKKKSKKNSTASLSFPLFSFPCPLLSIFFHDPLTYTLYKYIQKWPVVTLSLVKLSKLIRYESNCCACAPAMPTAQMRVHQVLQLTFLALSFLTLPSLLSVPVSYWPLLARRRLSPLLPSTPSLPRRRTSSRKC